MTACHEEFIHRHNPVRDLGRIAVHIENGLSICIKLRDDVRQLAFRNRGDVERIKDERVAVLGQRAGKPRVIGRERVRTGREEAILVTPTPLPSANDIGREMTTAQGCRKFRGL